MSEIMLELMKQHGYVPDTCVLNGELIFYLVKDGEDPCAGCTENRDVCNGRPKKKEEPWTYGNIPQVT